MRGSGLLKFSGIPLTMVGVLGILLGLVVLLWMAAWDLLVGHRSATALPYVIGSFTLIGGVLQGMAGIIGIQNCKRPEKADACLKWGIIAAVLCAIGFLITAEGLNVIPEIVFYPSLILPLLYLAGAVRNKAK